MAKTVTQKINIDINAKQVKKQLSDLQSAYNNFAKGVKTTDLFGNLKELNKIKFDKNKFTNPAVASRSYIAGSIAIEAAKKVFEITKKIADTFNDILKDTIGISLSFKDILTDVTKRIGEALDMRTGIATYSMQTSLFTNREARERQMRYGISAGQTYALTQTMQMLNMQNEEDLMYMNLQQRAVFQELMSKYQSWYEQLNENGVLREVQAFQLEFNLFKQKLAMEFLTWFAKNKDAIFDTIKVIANFIMQLATAFTRFVTMFFGDKSKTTSEAIGVGVMSDKLTYMGSGESKSVVVNINQSNNITGVDTNSFDEVFRENNKKMLKEAAIEIGAI